MTATACKTKSYYEFLLSNVTKITNTIYSPPFGTSHDMFWQLEFMPNSPKAPDHCSAFLFAIPNHEEERNSGTWTRRSALNAKIYLKNPRSQTFLKKQAVKMNSFSKTLSGWGWEAFFIKANLPDHVLFGVEFERVEMGLVSQLWPLPSDPSNSGNIPHDLSKAWESLLNNPIASDIQFNIQGQVIYANSSILSSRSKYFQLVLQGKWLESEPRNPDNSDNVCSNNNNNNNDNCGTISNNNSNNNNNNNNNNNGNSNNSQQIKEKRNTHHHSNSQLSRSSSNNSNQGSNNNNNNNNNSNRVIEVIDFHYLTFLEMLRFLYTNDVAFDRKNEKNSHVSAIELYRISDKYLIDDLRERAKARIFKDLNISDAAEFLFGTAWKYPELKEEAMKFFVSNFTSIRQTTGFKNIFSDHSDYPAFTDLFHEALAELFPQTGSVNTGKPVKEGF